MLISESAPPAAVTSFVGREDDLSRLCATVRAHRLVTVTGFGGVGKTRLVQEFSRRHADQPNHSQLRVVELQAVPPGADLAEALLTALGVVAAQGSAAEALETFLADRELWLVLDNCDHLLDEVRTVLAGLLRRAPGLTVVTTSREPLGIFAEQLVPLRPLPVPPADTGLETARSYPAVELLQARCRAVDPDFVIDDRNVGDAVSVCRRLDGLPLAIELAATRLRLFDLHGLAQELDDRFALLSRGDPTAAPRHQTLRAVVEWSYELCTPGERRLWIQLSIFAGGAFGSAVSAVCLDPAEGPDATPLLNRLEALIAQSIVTRLPTPVGPGFVMLKSIREFGRQLAESDPNESELQARYIGHYLAVAERCDADWFGPGQQDADRRLDLDVANLRAAFDRLLTDDPTGAMRLAGKLGTWWLSTRNRMGWQWLHEALAAGPASVPERILALSRLAVVAGAYPEVEELIAEAERLIVDLDREQDRGALLAAESIAALWRADPARAVRVGGQALAVIDPKQDVFSYVTAVAGVTVGKVLGQDPEVPAALDRLDQVCDELDYRWGSSWARALHAVAAMMAGDQSAVVEHGLAGLAPTVEVDDLFGTAHLLSILGQVALRTGRLSLGGRLIGAASQVGKEAGMPPFQFSGNARLMLPELLRGVPAPERDLAFERATEEGRTITGTAVVTLAEGLRQAETGARTATHRLSRRELEAVQAVVRGQTNREIAAELVLSVRTIDGHIERILGKLGVRRRTEIATWAIRELDR